MNNDNQQRILNALSEGTKLGSMPSTPPPPLPGEPPLPTHDEEDRVVLMLVDTYRYGVLLNNMPLPDLELPSMIAAFDRTLLLTLIRSTCTFSIEKKAEVLASLPAESQDNINKLYNQLEERRRTIERYPPKHLWHLRLLEWKQGIEWCDLEKTSCDNRGDSERSLFWKTKAKQFGAQRLQTLKQAVNTSVARNLPVKWRIHCLHSLAAALRDNDQPIEAEECERMASRISASEIASCLLRCQRLLMQSLALTENRRYVEAEQCLRESYLIVKQETNDSIPTYHILKALASVLVSQGRYRDAEQEADAALSAAIKEGLSVDSRCEALLKLGQVRGVLADRVGALRCLRHALQLSDEAILCPSLQCQLWESLGNELRVQGLYSEAEVYARKAVDTACSEKLSASCQCGVLNSLADVHLSRGRYRMAEHALREALQIATVEVCDPFVLYRILLSLGNVLNRQSRCREAELHLQRALHLSESESLGKLSVCNCRLILATVYANLGKHGDAERTIRIAEQIAEMEGFPQLFDCIRFLATLLNDEERHVEAEAMARKALRIAESHGSIPLSKCIGLTALGASLISLGRSSEAEQVALEAVQLLLDSGIPEVAHIDAILLLSRIYVQQGRLGESLAGYIRCRELLFKHLSAHSSLAGVPECLLNYNEIFTSGFRTSESLWRESEYHTPSLTWETLVFWDADRCVSVRERLRKHLTRRTTVGGDGAAMVWEPGPPNWRQLFETDPPQDQTAALSAVRGVWHNTDAGVAEEASPQAPMESHVDDTADLDDDRTKFCQPISPDELKALLLTDQTVILGFYSDGDDVVVLPIRKNATTGEAEILFLDDEQGRRLFRATGVRPALSDPLSKHASRLKSFVTDRRGGQPSEVLNEQFNLRELVYEPLYRALNLDHLLQLITREGESTTDLHLIVIPDDFLFQLPLHAACGGQRNKPFISQVGSINYGLSLRTLELQRQIDDADQSDRTNIEATVFAYPDREKEVGDYLSFTRSEIEGLEKAWGASQLCVYGEREPRLANRVNLRQRHALGNVYYNISHGGKMKDMGSDGTYSVFLADGPVSELRMINEGYDFRPLWLAHFSSCLLGQIEQTGQSRELEGLIASLALLGCRRMSSALWQVCDQAGAEFGHCLAKALKEHAFVEKPDKHAFAIAYRQAILEFRQLDGGRWDHEFYWAPYVLYGLP